MPDMDRRLNPSLQPALLFAILFLLPLLSSCSSTPAPDEFRGTVFSDEREAQDFRLTDQFGRIRSLHQDFAGGVVVLTFLYTACPDVCPIVANHLRDISTLLEEDSSQVAIVIVSVDPEGDTVESVFDYSERWQMTNHWTYLTGDEASLKDVWKAYYIDPYIHGPSRAETPDTASASFKAASGGVDALVEQTGLIIHSAPIYIIDADGKMRSAFTLPLASDDVMNDVRLVGG